MKIFENFKFNTKHQLIILIILAFCLNVNTLFNEYALDDSIIFTNNSFVTKGVHGIPEILTTDLMKGTSVGAKELTQPRYRPFSQIIFAIEYQFFGTNPMVSHLINLLLFIFLIALLFKLLNSFIFQQQHKYLAFITCLLFVVHPIHTEVIANVKSRDELITFLLLIISLIQFIKYAELKKITFLLFGLLCFFIALLTRESAITFVGIVPLVLYFFFNKTFIKSLVFSIPLAIVTILYLALRFSIVGFKYTVTDVLIAPFLYASPTQAFATKVLILIKYIGLLISPFPLSWEYGYNQIPYIDINSIPFILSSLLIITLLFYAVYTFKKRDLLSFSIMYFFVTISLVCNILVDIGTPLSERLLFQPSLAFCMVVAFIYLKANEKAKYLTNFIFIIILIVFSLKTILRNAEWKNDESIYFTDVNSTPNSIRTNMTVASEYNFKTNTETNIELRKEYFKKSIFYSSQALKIKSNNPRSQMDLLYSYHGLLNCYPAADFFLQDNLSNLSTPEGKIILNILSDELYKNGNGFIEQGNIANAIESYSNCLKLNKTHTQAWYNLGGCYYSIKDTINANRSWAELKKLDPNFIINKK
ncbi:MAG: hypothetical protein NTX97_11900 [Bacteroidetes bacterium]|nr:hypothetical protein [Bacteroidota bacterium]